MILFPPVPTAPTGVCLQQISEETLLATWIASEDTAVTGYIIHYQRDGGEEHSVSVGLRTSASTNVTGLKTGTYSVTIIATSALFASLHTTPTTIDIGNTCTLFKLYIHG